MKTMIASLWTARGRSLLSRTALPAFLLVVSMPAMAAIIDQQSTLDNSFLSGSNAAGQSFTPTLTGIDYATFRLSLTSGTPSVHIDLYQGAGFGGNVIGSTPSQLVAALGDYTFTFGSVIALTPGQVYTLRLLAAGGTITEREGTGNPYAGGDEYGSTGLVQTGFDMVFSEGLTNSVPEPGSMLLSLTGGLALLAWRRCG